MYDSFERTRLQPTGVTAGEGHLQIGKALAVEPNGQLRLQQGDTGCCNAAHCVTVMDGRLQPAGVTAWEGHLQTEALAEAAKAILPLQQTCTCLCYAA